MTTPVVPFKGERETEPEEGLPAMIWEGALKQCSFCHHEYPEPQFATLPRRWRRSKESTMCMQCRAATFFRKQFVASHG